MQTILAKLDIINWQDMQIAGGYPGKGSQIPFCIRGLLTETDPALLDRMEEGLQTALIHYSMVAESTVVTIPLIIELLASPQNRRKLRFLHILSAITYYSGEYPLLEPQVYAAMAAGLPVFRQFLHHRFPAYRLFAGKILEKFTPEVDEVANWLHYQIEREQNPNVCMHLLESLGRLLRDSPQVEQSTMDTVRFLLESLMNREDFYRRCMAASVYLRVFDTSATPDSVIETLFACFSTLTQRSWLEQYLTNRVVVNLRYLASEAEALKFMVRALEMARTASVADTVWLWLLRYPHFKQPQVDALRREFTAIEKVILDALLRCDVFWNGKKLARANHMASYGLAGTRHTLRKQVSESATI